MDTGMEVNWKNQQQYNQYDSPQVNRDQEGLQATPIHDDTKKYTSWVDDPQHPKRKILGLPIVSFWILVVVLVLVVAGAIGGGVGAGLAAQKRVVAPSIPQTSATSTPSATSSSPTQSSQTSSKSSSTTSAPISGPSPVIKTPCADNPASNNTVLTAGDATGASLSTFRLLCNTNYPGGSAYGNPNVIDMFRVYTADMQGCIDQCVAWNTGYAVTNLESPKCAVVAVVKSVGEFCYLKSATGKNDTSTSGGALIDSAVLIG